MPVRGLPYRFFVSSFSMREKVSEGRMSGDLVLRRIPLTLALSLGERGCVIEILKPYLFLRIYYAITRNPY